MNSVQSGVSEEEQTSHSRPLEGMRVIDLTDHRGDVGPWMLGELGADVIKVEPPGGCSTRALNPIRKDDISDLPALINVWATWCIACRVEHPFLMKLKEESILKIYGLNYKDDKNKALELLKRDGNPFEFSIYDFEGRLAIDLGVYGAPETFFIDKRGVIRERHVGVIDEKVWETKFAKYLDE